MIYVNTLEKTAILFFRKVDNILQFAIMRSNRTFALFLFVQKVGWLFYY